MFVYRQRCFFLNINIMQIVVRRNKLGHLMCTDPLPQSILSTLLNLTHRKLAFVFL